MGSATATDHLRKLSHGDLDALLVDKHPAAVVEEAEAVVGALLQRDAPARFDGIDHQLLNPHDLALAISDGLPSKAQTFEQTW